MAGTVAQLLVRSPAGVENVVELDGAVTVGRATPQHRPDVALDDPHQWVGRTHCSLAPRRGGWYLTDGGTVNGTLVERDGHFQRVDGEMRIREGDDILILGDQGDAGEPRYWRLSLQDPFATHSAPSRVRPREPASEPVPAGPPVDDPPCLEYDWPSARIYRRGGGVRTEVVGLRPKAHELIRHMVARAEQSGSSAVVCTHDELLEALFGRREEWMHDRAYTEQDIRDVISDARRAIEPDRQHPVLLQTVRGFGYRIVAWLPPEG